MNRQSPQRSSSSELSSAADLIFIESVKDVLERLAAIETEFTDLNQCREKTIDLLLEATGSVVGYWAMGQGHPMQGQIAPLVWVHRGIPPEQLGAFLELGLSPLSDTWIRSPFVPLLQEQMQVCRYRSEFYSDAQWKGCELVTRHLQPLGLENWLIAVRYPSENNWSSLTLFRELGRPDFSYVERCVLDLVLASKSWLHFRLSHDSGPKASELSSRNATVLLMLLDGYSRKEIAAQMGLSLHIVNDSMKTIYRHFDTSSATELAARFLKGL